MGELVRDDGFEIVGLESREQPGRDDDRVRAQSACDRERVRQLGVEHLDARNGQVGQAAETLHDGLQGLRLFGVGRTAH